MSEPNTIDILMSLDPVELSKDPKALDAIIAHYRNTRAREGEDGKMTKAKRPKATATSTVSLTDVLKTMLEAKGTVAPKASSGGGVRRV